MLQFGILGPLEVRSGEALVDVGRPKQRAVLAALLIEANRVVAVDSLVERLWGDDAPARAVDSLQVYISGLRRALEPGRAAGTASTVLVTRPPGYVLCVEAGALDATRFEALASEGHRLLAGGRPQAALGILDEALALWRGPALAEFAFETFASAEAGRLEELRAVATEGRLEGSLAMGDHLRAVAELEVAVGERPLRERLWGLLMLALYRSGRQGEALRAYGRARTVLVDEMGIDPGPELRRLEAEILAQSPGLDHLAVVEPAPTPPATPPPAPWRSGLVGRNDARATLDEALTRTLGGRGALVLVSGEAGIGKSRLVEELAARAAEAGGTVAVGRCHEGEGAPSFWPWVQVVRGLLRDVEPAAVRSALMASSAEIAQIVPEIKEVFDDLEPPPPLDPAAARFRLYDAFAGFLTRLAAGRPLVVVLDDLHWADLPSLELAELVADRVARTGLLVVGAFRDNDPAALSGPLARTLGVLARSSELRRVALVGLSPAEVARFIADTAGVEPTPAVAAAIHARTEGNPFFVAELTRLLAGRDALSAGATTDDAGTPAAVPPGVRDVIRLRLVGLPAPTTELLELASVVGRDIDLALVAVAARIDRGEVLERLEAAGDAGVVVDDPVVLGRLRFSHGLVQETIYRDLGAARRARLHARVAGALDSLHADDRGHAVELAHHLYQAAAVLGAEWAFSAAIKAANAALATLAYEQAEQQLRRAVELAGTMPAGPERWKRELDAQVHLASLLSQTLGYHMAAVTDAWDRARDGCEQLGDSPEVLVPVLWAHARSARAQANYELLDRIGRQLLELPGTTTDSAAAVAGHEARGSAALYRGELVAAVAHLARVVALVDRPSRDGGTGALVHHPGVLCGAYLALAHCALGHDEEAEARIGAALQLARDSGNPFNEALALLVTAQIAYRRDRPDIARRMIDEVFERDVLVGFGPIRYLAGATRAWADARLGRPEGAAARLRRVLADLSSDGWRLSRTYHLTLLAEVLLITGDIEGALTAVDDGLAEVEATGERLSEAGLCLLRGELSVADEPGNPSAAEAWFRRALAVAESQQAVPLQRRAAAALARLPTPEPNRTA